MRDAVQRLDFCGCVVAAVCLHAVAVHAARLAPRYARGMGWVAAVALLSVGGLGYAELKPSTTPEYLGVAILTWAAASASALAAVVVLPVLDKLWGGIRAAAEARRDAAVRRDLDRRRAKAEADRARAAAEWERRRPEPVPPPPTKYDRATAARAKYEEAVRVLEAAGLDEAELQAAKQKAKQKYLRDIDGVL